MGGVRPSLFSFGDNMIKVKALRDFGSEDYGYLRTGDIISMRDNDAANLRSHGYVEFFEVEDDLETAENYELKVAVESVTRETRKPRKATA